MLIRIKQVRRLDNGEDFGTDIPFGKGKSRVVLEFRPRVADKPDRDHVCDVKDPELLARLLAIREGFEVHPSVKDTPEAKAALKRAESATPVASSGVASFSDDELEAELERRAAAKAKPASEAVATEEDAGDQAGGGDEQPKLSKAELVAAVEAKTGKKPHPSTSEKKLRELLAG